MGRRRPLLSRCGAAIVQSHQAAKTVARRSGWSDETLHLHVGLAIYLLVASRVRDGLRSPVPFAAIAAVEVANEALDRVRKGTWRWHETLPDLLHTLIWPVTITLVARADGGRATR